MSIQSFLNTVVGDVKVIVADVKAAGKWFVKEIDAAVAWVDKEVPGAQAQIATIIQAGEADMEVLEKYASQGFGDLIEGALDVAETAIMNHLGSAGLPLATTTTLTSGAVATITAIGDIVKATNGAALSSVLTKTAGAVASINQANGTAS